MELSGNHCAGGRPFGRELLSRNVVAINKDVPPADFVLVAADRDQMPDDSALIRSSGKPSALPTSRMAPLARDGRAERRLVVAYQLDHLFPPFVLKIDIDVGLLVAFLGNEPLEQKIVGFGIDRGDVEHIADG